MTLSGTSSRRTGLPMSFHAPGSLSLTSAGGGSAAAAAAIVPNATVRPLGACVTTLLRAWHCAAGTFQRAAAAAISISRAVAPAFRK